MQVYEIKKPGGWSEMGIYTANGLQAVISHPMTGAKWFYNSLSDTPSLAFKTRRAALAHAMEEMGATKWTRRQ